MHRSALSGALCAAQRLQAAQPQTRAFGLVPMVIETSGRGERAFDIFSRLLRVRFRVSAKPTRRHAACCVPPCGAARVYTCWD